MASVTFPKQNITKKRKYGWLGYKAKKLTEEGFILFIFIFFVMPSFGGFFYFYNPHFILIILVFWTISSVFLVSPTLFLFYSTHEVIAFNIFLLACKESMIWEIQMLAPLIYRKSCFPQHTIYKYFHFLLGTSYETLPLKPGALVSCTQSNSLKKPSFLYLTLQVLLMSIYSRMLFNLVFWH